MAGGGARVKVDRVYSQASPTTSWRIITPSKYLNSYFL